MGQFPDSFGATALPAAGRSKKVKRSGSIRIKPSHRGLLHKDLGVPQSQPIPASKLQQALESANPAVRKRANFARNAKKFKH